MIIKKKSLIVTLVSGIVISTVLILTLVGYLTYVELKGEEFRRFYALALKNIEAGKSLK